MSLHDAIDDARLLIAVEKRIRHEGGKYCVYSKDGSRKFGCYDTKAQAVERLRQIEGHKKSYLAKGLPAEINDGGIHIHGLERESLRTKMDGAHSHIFLVKNGLGIGADSDDPDNSYPDVFILNSDEDGAHTHSMLKSDANSTSAGGSHFHTVYMPDGTMMETTEDGDHQHPGLQVATTAFDGAHVHELDVGKGKVLRSLTPAEIWKELLVEPPQRHLPNLPPSKLFAQLAPETHGALRSSMMDQQMRMTADRKAKLAEEDFDKGIYPTLKLDSAKFVVNRLRMEKDVGILSWAARKYRIDESHALISHLRSDISMLWGFMKFAGCERFKSFEAIPDELLDTISPEMRKIFDLGGSETPVYYTRIEASKLFDEPKMVGKVPNGNVFGGGIDVEKDILTTKKCKKCESPFVVSNELDATLTLCEDCTRDTINKLNMDRAVRILKADDSEERIVFGAVLIPGETDAQGDAYTEDDVRKAAYSFMEIFGGKMKLMHRGEPLDDGTKVLETYLTKQEEAHGGETLPKGTWLVTARIGSDALWQEVKEGRWTGFSMGGSAIREPLA